jgi:hypothetical protein
VAATGTLGTTAALTSITFGLGIDRPIRGGNPRRDFARVTLILLRRENPLMALFDRRGGSLVWSLSGEKPTSGQNAQNDAVDP